MVKGPPPGWASRADYERFWFGPESAWWVLCPLAVALVAGVILAAVMLWG